jgi:hypothetical protein
VACNSLCHADTAIQPYNKEWNDERDLKPGGMR